MPLPYTGQRGELNFEEDFIEGLIGAGWEKEVLKEKTEVELIENWKNIIFENNKERLNNIQLSVSEMNKIMDILKVNCNTPARAHLWLMDGQISIIRDSDSADIQNAGKEVFLSIFNKQSIAGGNARYQIVEQPIFNTSQKYNDRRGDILLLMFGIPVIHIELKASGVRVEEAYNQIIKYSKEGVFTGLFSTIQVFFAINPEDALYFANAGNFENFNPAFFFRWADRENRVIKDWKKLLKGEFSLLSIPEAHQLVGYYTVTDKGKESLMVARSYQVYAIRAINARVQNHKWGSKAPLGGYIWCTTGGGKTLTSFKAGEQIIDLNRADKIVFVVDRVELDNQSRDEYNNFCRNDEEVLQTTSSTELYKQLLRDSVGGKKTDFIITSIQKLSRIDEEKVGVTPADLDKINAKRIVFIVDEAHRSQFGTMHERIKRVFSNALFFGFTGTPIFSENDKDGKVTEASFGDCISIYSLADGIRDKNVLGFLPFKVYTYDEKDLRKEVALHEANAKTETEVLLDPVKLKRYKYFQDSSQVSILEIEKLLPSEQYNNQKHREAVVKDIKKNWISTSVSKKIGHFHAILATSSIPEAIEYYKLFKVKCPELNVTALFDPNIDNTGSKALNKMDALIEIVEDYNEKFGTNYNRDSDPNYKNFKTDIVLRLSHKKPYNALFIKRIDIVIVVNQLLTGFDSQFVNTLYLDKELETDNLIQAISRTNRVLDEEDKPFGIFKYYRKPRTMTENVKTALELYCKGDTSNVMLAEIDENLDYMNESFEKIKRIFEASKVQNFAWLPKDNESCLAFKKEFKYLKSLFQIVKLQGFSWNNRYGNKLNFDEFTYTVLKNRYNDLSKGRNNSSSAGRKPGYDLDTISTEVEMEKIDADYLDKLFKTLTSVLLNNVSYEQLKQAIENFEKQMAILSMEDQAYARQVVSDIKTGILIADENKSLIQYIAEYKGDNIDRKISELAEKYKVSKDELTYLYRTAVSEQDLNKNNRFNNMIKQSSLSFKEKAVAQKELKAFLLEKSL